MRPSGERFEHGLLDIEWEVDHADRSKTHSLDDCLGGEAPTHENPGD